MWFNTRLGLNSGSRMAKGLIEAASLFWACLRAESARRSACPAPPQAASCDSKSQWQTDMASFSMKALSCSVAADSPIAWAIVFFPSNSEIKLNSSPPMRKNLPRTGSSIM